MPFKHFASRVQGFAATEITAEARFSADLSDTVSLKRVEDVFRNDATIRGLVNNAGVNSVASVPP